jgi:hypothetical protein
MYRVPTSQVFTTKKQMKFLNFKLPVYLFTFTMCSMKNVRTSVTLDLYVSTLLQLYTDSIHSSTIGFNAFLEILF